MSRDGDRSTHELQEGLAAAAALWRELVARRGSAGVPEGPVDPRYFRGSRTLHAALEVLERHALRARPPRGAAWYSPQPSVRRSSP